MQQMVPLSLRVFDCLHVDGQDLIDAPLSERRGKTDGFVPIRCACLAATSPAVTRSWHSCMTRLRRDTKA